MFTIAEASNQSSQNTKKQQKSLSPKEFNNKFSNGYAKLKDICRSNVVNKCDWALISATAYADWAMGVCDRNGLDSWSCWIAQGIAFYELDTAISECSKTPGSIGTPVSKIESQKPSQKNRYKDMKVLWNDVTEKEKIVR